MPVVTKKTTTTSSSAVPTAQSVKKMVVKKAEPIPEPEPEPEAESDIEMEEEAEAEPEVENSVDAVLSRMKEMSSDDIFKVMKLALAEAEKKAKGGKGKKSEKKESSKKGRPTPQLDKPRAWVNWVLQYALANGWESFVISEKKRGSTDEVNEIEMPASELSVEGAYIYEGSVTEKEPHGKQITLRQAMSLSKQYWSPKTKTGTRPELYEEFESEYVPPSIADDESKSISTETSSKKIVRMTAAEREAEKERKLAEKEAEKAAKKAEKDAERAEKKAAKEAEKAAEKAAKEAEKAAKKAASGKPGKTPSKPVPVAAVKKGTAGAGAPEPAAATKTVVVKKAAAAKKDDWEAPTDGNAKPWTYKGKKYVRTAENFLWEMSSSGEMGAWVGVYDPVADKIDDSVAEPEFEDEE